MKMDPCHSEWDNFFSVHPDLEFFRRGVPFLYIVKKKTVVCTRPWRSETSTKTQTVHKPDVNVHRASEDQVNVVSSPKAVQFSDGF